MRASAAALLVLASSASSPSNAEAQELFDVRPEIDGPVIALSLAVGALPELIRGFMTGPPCLLRQLPLRQPVRAPATPETPLPGCDPLEVPAFDRWAIGQGSRVAALLSDSLIVAVPIAGLSIAFAEEQGRPFWQDTVVILEAYAINFLLVSIAKYAVRRPRPYVYDPGQPPEARNTTDAQLSFYSGHTATTFAAAVGFSEVFRRRHDGVAVPIFYASSVALAGLMGFFRILAGKHFLSDVLAGAIVGTSIGILIPALHDRDMSP
jgi:membrane-associated phospholipid phosphatase